MWAKQHIANTAQTEATVTARHDIIDSRSPAALPVRRGSDDPADLVAAAAAGDSRAWDALIERFSGLVWSIVRDYRLNAADSADVTQVVWLRLVENLGRIRKPGSVGPWLASVTRHECLRILRRSTRETLTTDDFETDPAFSDCEVDRRLLEDEREAALTRAFADLPPRWRSLLEILTAAPAATYEEVAATLAMPIGSIGPTRQRCLERLRTSPELVGLIAA